MVARRRSVVIPRRRTPNLSWTGLFPVANQAIPAASKLLLGSFVLSGAFDETITRTRGRVMYTSDQSATAEVSSGAIGLIVVSEDAFSIGITAIPDPVNDVANDGWLMWHPLIAKGLIGELAPGDSLVDMIDSKAQRIVREGSRLVLVAANSHATFGAAITVAIRVLARFRS